MWATILSLCYAFFFLASLIIFILLFDRRPLRVRSGLVMLPACAFISFGSIVQANFPEYSTLLLFYYLNTLAFLVIFTSFVFFVGEFTGRYDPLKRNMFVLIMAIPTAVAISVMTDPWLHLYNSSYILTTIPDYGVPFLVSECSWMRLIWQSYCMAVGLGCIYHLIVGLHKSGNKTILAIILAGVMFCYGLNFASLYELDLMVMPIDGLTFTLASISFYTAALGFGIFDIAPVARKKMLDLIQDAIFVIDPEGMVNDINRRGLELVGKERKEVLHKRPDALIDKFPDLVRLLNDPGSEPQMVITDGDGRTYDIKLNSFDYGKMRQNGRMLIVQDVTERLRIEQRIRDAETQMQMAEANKRYKTLVDNQTEAIITLDDTGRITFINPVLEGISRRFGWELLGLRIDDLWDREDSIAFWTLVKNTAPEAPEFHFEHVIDLLHGDERYFLWQGKVLYDEEGAVTEIQAAGIDVTERRRSEAEYRAIVESQKGMIVLMDKSGKITLANQACSRFYGVPMEKIIGSRFIPLADEGDLENYAEAVRSLTPGSPDRDFLVLRVYFPDGSTRTTEWTLRGMFDSQGHLVECQNVGNDITEKLKMEQELNKAQKLESLGILAGGIAHDFNNLLTSIVSNIEVAAMEVSMQERGRHRLDEAVRSSLKAKNLTHQLLTFSKGGKPVKEPIDLAELLTTTIEFTLTGTNVKAEYRIAEDLSQVLADHFQIEQVINNLVINAVQAMPEGGKIFVKASSVDAYYQTQMDEGEQGYVRIKITDQGPGIPTEIIDSIFDPFFTTKEKGTGLGLSTVQSIIKNHNGFIDMESDPGLGTSFTILLPACETGTAGLLEERASEVMVGGARILVMDDEESILEVLSTILEEMGHEVVKATNGEEAIGHVSDSLSEGRPFDLLIMDLTIRGGMGGKDAILEILKLDPGTKAMVSSGYSNDPVMAEPRKYGFIDFLPKPYSIQTLQDKLAVLLEHDQEPTSVEV